MGFNKRKMEDRRRQEAEKEATARRATQRQILEDAEQLVTVWNERQAKRMPMLFSPTIGAAITAGYWFLRVRCQACAYTASRRGRSRAAGSGGASASRQRGVESYLADICDHVAGRGSFDHALLPDVADFHQTFELKTGLIAVATSIAGPLQLLQQPDLVVS
jgi:hypothetical protein